MHDVTTNETLKARLIIVSVRAYIETALRLAEQRHAETIDVKEQEQLSAIIIGLKISMDNIINDY